MYLLDTVVLSELRKRRRDKHVVAWLESVSPSDLYISVITVAEIEQGIAQQRKANPTFASDLEQWLESLLRLYGDHVLAFTISMARRWGQLTATIGNSGLDLAIAATAQDQGLTVVTRNVTDFDRTGVPTLNPFAHRP